MNDSKRQLYRGGVSNRSPWCSEDYPRSRNCVSFAVLVYRIKIYLGRGTAIDPNNKPTFQSTIPQKCEYVHRNTIRDWDNKRCPNTSFGRRRKGIRSPAPSCWIIMRILSTEQNCGRNSHDQGKQAIIPSHNQKKCKVRSADALLHRSSEDDIPHKWNSAGEHDMPSPVACAIAVPGLEENHKPSYNVRCDCKTLCIYRWKSKIFNQLFKDQIR